MSLNNLKLTEDYQFLSQNYEARQLLLNPLLMKDVWQTEEDLGLKINKHQKYLTLNFSDFPQNWLKLLVKLYTLVRAKPGTSVISVRQNPRRTEGKGNQG